MLIVYKEVDDEKFYLKGGKDQWLLNAPLNN